jgi:hypothetical protein
VPDILHLRCQNQNESELFGFTVVLPPARLLGTASGENPAPCTGVRSAFDGTPKTISH